MLLRDDFWVGKAITDGRIAYEVWIALLRGEIKVEPEFAPNLIGGGCVDLFTNYAKGIFLSATAALHRGFQKAGAKTDVAHRMQEALSTEKQKIDDFFRLAEPFREFRNFDQHRENPRNPEIWTVRIDQGRPIMGTPMQEYIDPVRVYETLKSLELRIGYMAFVRAAARGAQED